MKTLNPILLVLVVLIAASLACSMPLTPAAAPTPTSASTATPTSTPSFTYTPIVNSANVSPLVTVTTQPVIANTSVPPTQTVPPAPTAIVNNANCNVATFEGDVTYEDDSVIPAGSSFEKKWRLGNAGSCTWTSGYRIIFVSGDAMGGSGSTQLTTGTVPPGTAVEAAVNLVAPSAAGTYQGNFKLQASDGTVFGLGTAGNVFYLRIVVEESGSSSSGGGTVLKPKIPNIIVPVTPALTRNLKLTSPYMTGNDVLTLQKRLLALGYSVVGTADGIFGAKTNTAVRNFQADKGLVVDGIVGQKTWAALWD